MKTIQAATATISLVVVLAVSVPAAEPQHHFLPMKYAEIVRQKLPAGWRCTYDFQSVVIMHEEPVTLLNTLSLPGSERNEAFFRTHGIQSSYLFVMKFVPRLSHEEQNALFEGRKNAVNEARAGRERLKPIGDDIYGKWFVPEYYNQRFSIDLHRTDSWPLQVVAPAGVVQERNDIFALLESLMDKYPNQP